MQRFKSLLIAIFSLYRDGFKNMRLGKKLWLIAMIKLFIIFAVIKYFFFPDVLQEHFQNDAQRSDYILNQLTQGE